MNKTFLVLVFQHACAFFDDSDGFTVCVYLYQFFFLLADGATG